MNVERFCIRIQDVDRMIYDLGVDRCMKLIQHFSCMRRNARWN